MVSGVGDVQCRFRSQGQRGRPAPQHVRLPLPGFPEQRARRVQVEAERHAAIAAHEARVESALEYVTQEGQVMQDEATAAVEVAAEKAVEAQRVAQAEAAAVAAAAPPEVKKAPTKRGRKPKKKEGS